MFRAEDEVNISVRVVEVDEPGPGVGGKPGVQLEVTFWYPVFELDIWYPGVLLTVDV